MIPSGGFRGGSRGSLEPSSGAKLFPFHGEFQEILCEIRQTNPPFLHLNPLLRNPGSAPDTSLNALDENFVNEEVRNVLELLPFLLTTARNISDVLV